MFIRSVRKPNGSTAYIIAGKPVKVRKYPKVTEIELFYTKWNKNTGCKEEVVETVPFFGMARSRVNKLDLSDSEKVVLIEMHFFDKNGNGEKKPCGDNLWFSGDRYFEEQFMDDEGNTSGIHVTKGLLYFNKYGTAEGTRCSGSIKIRAYKDKNGIQIPEHYMNFQFLNKCLGSSKKTQAEIAESLFNQDPQNKAVEAIIVAGEATKYFDGKGQERTSYNVLSMHPCYAV